MVPQEVKLLARVEELEAQIQQAVVVEDYCKADGLKEQIHKLKQEEASIINELSLVMERLGVSETGQTEDAAAMQEAKTKAKAEAKVKAELEVKAKAEAEARVKAEAEAKVEAEAKDKPEAEAKTTAEVKAKAEAEAKVKAKAEAKKEKEKKKEKNENENEKKREENENENENEKERAPCEFDKSRTVKVTNISERSSTRLFSIFFEPCGKMTSIYIDPDKTFGLMEFSTTAEAETALRFSGSNFLRNAVTVEMYDSSNDSTKEREQEKGRRKEKEKEKEPPSADEQASRAA